MEHTNDVSAAKASIANQVLAGTTETIDLLFQLFVEVIRIWQLEIEPILQGESTTITDC